MTKRQAQKIVTKAAGDVIAGDALIKEGGQRALVTATKSNDLFARIIYTQDDKTKIMDCWAYDEIRVIQSQE